MNHFAVLKKLTLQINCSVIFKNCTKFPSYISVQYIPPPEQSPINIRFISGLFRNVIKTVQFFYFDFFCSTLYLWDASILVFMQLQFISFHCFMNKLYIIALSIVRIYHISFIYSAVNGYWRCFKTLAIINNAAMNMFSGEQIHAFLLDQQEQNC